MSRSVECPLLQHWLNPACARLWLGPVSPACLPAWLPVLCRLQGWLHTHTHSHTQLLLTDLHIQTADGTLTAVHSLFTPPQVGPRNITWSSLRVCCARACACVCVENSSSEAETVRPEFGFTSKKKKKKEVVILQKAAGADSSRDGDRVELSCLLQRPKEKRVEERLGTRPEVCSFSPTH